MKTNLARPAALLLAFAILPHGYAQSAPPRQTGEDSDDEVVRITTNLVQVDAVVTDRDGRQVTDLRPEDFEILEDGKARPITNFSYVSAATAATVPAASAPASATSGKPTAIPPARLRPGDTRRTIVLVVDDLNLAHDSVRRVREAVRKFLDEQIRPGDLVAILRTGGEMGALQQFSNDKTQLYAAAERIRFNLTGRGRAGAFAPAEGDPEKTGGGQTLSDARDDIDQLRDRLFQDASLAALTFILQSLRKLPGRKNVVLFSDGLTLRTPESVSKMTDRIRLDDGSVVDKVNALIDLAGRSSAVLYTIDARGLPSTYQAEDNLTGMNPQAAGEVMQGRTGELFNSQGGLSELAHRTGGLFLRNTNDIGGALRRVVDDLGGYYLLGYRPEATTFGKSRRFRGLTVRVKRPGLSVRTRAGFLNLTEKESQPTPEQAQIEALVSPFETNDVRVRLTASFADDARAGSYLSTLLHVDARDLTFKEEADGWRTAVVDLVAMTFGDNGRLIEKLDQTSYTFRLRGQTYQRALQNGFVHRMNVPVKKPGAYHLRVSVRDAATKRLGSAGQFVVVPDLSKDRLALSGVILRGATLPTGGETNQPAAGGPDAGAASAQDTAAARRFAPGAPLDYDLVVYNARLDKTTRLPRLTTQVRLFRDGQLVNESQPLTADTRGQADLKRIRLGGRLTLAPTAPPGEYAVQIVVTDELAKEGERVVAQWVDFELVGRR